MSRRTRYINGKSGAALGNSTTKGFEADMNLNRDDSALLGIISEYMKGRLDLEDVRNDPDFLKTEETVKEMISDYNKNLSGNYKNEKFIRDIFSERTSEEKIIDDINHIKEEIENSKLNEISAEWVKEWHEKRQKSGDKDLKTEEIRDFIVRSIESEKSEKEISLNPEESKGSRRSLMVRYISLSAAAVIGAFILLRTLLPSPDPEKIYDLYYKPFNVLSPVTRSANTKEPAGYSSSLEKYRLGDYQTAAIGFSDAMLKDTSVIAPRFFLGLTQMEMGNYEQAVIQLGGIADRSGEYRKETLWYLGLTYLKTGDKENASRCFEFLAQSSGFYSERSAKILRRLK